MTGDTMLTEQRCEHCLFGLRVLCLSSVLNPTLLCLPQYRLRGLACSARVCVASPRCALLLCWLPTLAFLSDDHTAPTWSPYRLRKR